MLNQLDAYTEGTKGMAYETKKQIAIDNGICITSVNLLFGR